MYTSTSKLNKIYRYCSDVKGIPGENFVYIAGFTGNAHMFRRDRLEKHYIDILSAVKGMPEVMRYSNSKEGMPWIMARHHRKMGDINMDITEKLVVMAVTLGIMRIVRHKNMPSDVPYVVIDDSKLRKMEMMEPEGSRRKALLTW